MSYMKKELGRFLHFPPKYEFFSSSQKNRQKLWHFIAKYDLTKHFQIAEKKCHIWHTRDQVLKLSLKCLNYRFITWNHINAKGITLHHIHHITWDKAWFLHKIFFVMRKYDSRHRVYLFLSINVLDGRLVTECTYFELLSQN